MRNAAQRRLTRRLLLSAALLLAPACSVDHVPVSPAPVFPDSRELRGALLTTADLPAGFEVSTPERVDRPVSDRPECAATLDQLELDPPRAAGVGEARVLFSGDRELRIQHVVRRYPDVGADAAFGDAVATLANCGQFRLTYADQSEFQVTVVARPIAPVGAEAWSATIDVSTSLFQVTNTLVLVRKTDRIAVLSVSGLERPDLGLLDKLTTRVAELLSSA